MTTSEGAGARGTRIPAIAVASICLSILAMSCQAGGVPGIRVRLNETEIRQGGIVDIGFISTGAYKDVAFFVDSVGEDDLLLPEPAAWLSGTDAEAFSVPLRIASRLRPGETGLWFLRFGPATEGSRSIVAHIRSNDPDTPELYFTCVGECVDKTKL